MASARASYVPVAGLILALVMPPPRVAAMILDTPSGRLSLAAGPRASEEEELRAAILSVHAFVEKHREHGPLVGILDHVDPMPLQKAATIIANDRSALGDLHRRRALLRLLSWVRDVQDVPQAVETLVGSAEVAKKIYRELADRERSPACQPVDQETVNDLLNAMLGELSYGACPKVKLMTATVLEQAKNIGISSTLIAEGSLDGARKGLDPQRWCACSRLWDAAYMVKVASDGVVEDNGQCSPDDRPECMPAKGSSQPIGGAYDTDDPDAPTPAPPRPLFEHFVCDKVPCDVRLLLHIVTQRADASTSTTLPGGVDYLLTYDKPAQWKHFSFPHVDNGTVRVTAKDLGGGGQELTVLGDKTFGFLPWGTTSAVYLLLRRVETASYLADLVCCTPP